MKKVLLIAGLLQFTFLHVVWCRAQEPEMPAKVYDRVAPVVTKIRITSIARSGEKQEAKIGSGSVVGLTRDGRAVILTACHVVASNGAEPDQEVPLQFHPRFEVKVGLDSNFVSAALITRRLDLKNDRVLIKALKEGYLPQGYVVCFDRANDLALLVTRRPVTQREVMRYNHSDGVKPGQKVAAVGFPKTDELTLETGLITDRQDEKNFLVFKAKVVSGNSGGPVVDKHGRMIGMAIEADAIEGYARPMNSILSIVESWLKNTLQLPTIWQRQKYVSLWQRMYRDPVFLLSEAGAIGGTGYLLLRPPSTEAPIFGAPPSPGDIK